MGTQAGDVWGRGSLGLGAGGGVVPPNPPPAPRLPPAAFQHTAVSPALLFRSLGTSQEVGLKKNLLFLFPFVYLKRKFFHLQS